ncbi:SMEK domain-containing protein [Aliarcobacter butzleri]|uniref:SMEK domain-containing protein n=1 Tax=Aliarcobacter butzleri TaxID=28197 RepID=UPI0021B357FE|nr:SMEK domain-containing protein [Aliarcobacter butzleri]MCT7627049.1 SMEK domain-containing protein [Aliarcobacter butzleri]
MSEFLKQLEFIRNQFAWIKSKVELDNQLGLYDINKLGEDIFMHILNDVYDLNLKNANDILHDNFPSIDLVDENSKKVVQVTSTTTLKKARETIKKLRDLKFHEITDDTSNSLINSIYFFRQLEDYEEYEISFLYIKDKPNIKTESWKTFLEEENLNENNFIGLDDIIAIIQDNPTKCEILYKTIRQRLDNISFKFNIDSYFKLAEPHLENITNEKFKQYESEFKSFIQSKNKILEVFAVGGNGKSHLLRYLGNIETVYIPLIFTKQINIEEDLKKLDSSKKYLLIFDDIDRYLEQNTLLNLLAYIIQNPNTKLVLSFRTASKGAIEIFYRKFSNIGKQELEIIWEEKEIWSLIENLLPQIKEIEVRKLAYTFNNNPYLITQAIQGDIKNIQEFSKKIVEDTKVALTDFNLSDREIKDLLFNLSLLTPISKNNIAENYKNIINKLVEKKILRELTSKYRFNPDIIGDLYLAEYVDTNKSDFEKIVEDNLQNFSDTVFTNLSYALLYNKNNSLQSFIKSVINKWISKSEYTNRNLALVNKIVYFAPMESFIFLEKATKYLIPKETNNIPKSGIQEFVTTIAMDTGTYNSDNDAINLESIEPIISKLISALKNNVPTENLTMEHIIKYLTSEVVLNLPKAYYANQTLESIFKKLVSPLYTTNFDVIIASLEIMEKWIDETNIDDRKILLLSRVIDSLLNATFDDTKSDGVSITWGQKVLNLNHKEILRIIDKAKYIFFKMLSNQNLNISNQALDSVRSIGGYRLNSLSQETQDFYENIRQEALMRCIDIVEGNNDFNILSKIESIAINTLNFHDNKEIALALLDSIPRSDEYILYQKIKVVDFIIYDIKEFKENLPQEQSKIKDWIFDNIYDKKNFNLTEKEKQVIERLSKKYNNSSDFIKFCNNLDMSGWNSKNIWMQVLDFWYSKNAILLIEICQNHINEINDINIIDILKEFSFTNKILNINIDNINTSTTNDELKIYINSIFKNFSTNDLDILNKIVEVVAEKEKNDISIFISIISQKLYFTIANQVDLYKELEHIILKFLQWQYQYIFDIESYITHHILYETVDNKNISNEVKKVLEQIIKSHEIYIDEFGLKPIYRIIGYGLEECINILYNKLTTLDENKKPVHIFNYYFDSSKISEVVLLKSFIKSYSDFEILINRVIELYEHPIKFIGADGNEYERYIHLDYFFKYTINQEYITELFNGFFEKNDIEQIKFFYTIVPVNSTYLNIIIQNMNLLEDKVSENDLINYLRQVGKIKSFSRSHMQNSNLVLSEEALFTEIYKKVNSLSLQLKLKEELKYLEIQKRQELEEDIVHLLDK